MQVTINSNNPDQTAILASLVGANLGVGDVLLLRGPVGAGKTHFARHLILSVLATDEDVPSPTFTLVQTYHATTADVWHADLYRLSTLDEIEELGMIDAFDTAICLIEWPEILGPLTPPNSLNLTFAPDPDDENRRQITLNSLSERWTELLETVTNAA